MRLEGNLEELKRNNKAGYSVPDGYFDSLPAKIQERCYHTSESSDRVKIGFLSMLKPYFLIGSFMVIMTVGIYNAYEFVIPSTAVHHNIDMSSNAELLVQDIAYNINETDLIEFVDEENLNQNITDNNISEEAIEYLVDNDIDYSTLINE
ncbi:MAG: hypothetical protein N4A72_21710 [Bacteroidales bacterium]|jgi:hypothetical protein|nr:hypothetical protein [Bacteroidales bacterium]